MMTTMTTVIQLRDPEELVWFADAVKGTVSTQATARDLCGQTNLTQLEVNVNLTNVFTVMSSKTVQTV